MAWLFTEMKDESPFGEKGVDGARFRGLSPKRQIIAVAGGCERK